MPGLFVNFTATDQQTYDSIKAQLQQEPATLRPTIDAVRAAMVSADAWRSLAIIAVGFVIIFAYLKRYVKVDAAVATLLVARVVMIDMYAVNKRYINQDSFVSKYDMKPVNFEKRPADVQVLKDTAQTIECSMCKASCRAMLPIITRRWAVITQPSWCFSTTCLSDNSPKMEGSTLLKHSKEQSTSTK